MHYILEQNEEKKKKVSLLFSEISLVASFWYWCKAPFPIINQPGLLHYQLGWNIDFSREGIASIFDEDFLPKK